MPSACSRALQLPEIISSIFDAVCREPRWTHFRTLLSCTLVSPTWNEEANRRLWDHCGETSDYFNIPTIENLLALDSSKQQKFANYIRCIHVCYPDLSGDPDLSDDEEKLDWKGRFLPDLARFSFPRLEELDLDAPLDHDETTYPAPVLTQFVQPRLRRIRISATLSAPSFVLSEAWFIRLSQISRGLTEFCCAGTKIAIESQVSPAVLTSFLENMQFLNRLEWYSEISEDALMNLAKKTSFRHLEVSRIDEAGLNGFLIAQPGSLFQALAYLSCEISVEGLKAIAPHLRNLYTLNLQIPSREIPRDDTSKALRILSHSQMTNLVQLRVQPGSGDIIHAADLLALVQSLSHLNTLNMAYNSDTVPYNLPILQDLDDGMMDNIALSLPQVYMICLLSARDTQMTEKALLSLGRHCPKLVMCHLSAKPDYKILIREARSNGIEWGQLQDLNIEGNGEQHEWLNEERPSALAHYIGYLMPLIQEVKLNLDPDLERAIRTIIENTNPWQ